MLNKAERSAELGDMSNILKDTQEVFIQNIAGTNRIIILV